MKTKPPSQPGDLEILLACLRRKYANEIDREHLTPDRVVTTMNPRDVIRRLEELWRVGMVHIASHTKYAVPSELALDTYFELRVLEKELRLKYRPQIVGGEELREQEW